MTKRFHKTSSGIDAKRDFKFSSVIIHGCSPDF
jgi:hypothetical protein